MKTIRIFVVVLMPTVLKFVSKVLKEHILLPANVDSRPSSSGKQKLIRRLTSVRNRSVPQDTEDAVFIHLSRDGMVLQRVSGYFLTCWTKNSKICIWPSYMTMGISAIETCYIITSEILFLLIKCLKSKIHCRCLIAFLNIIRLIIIPIHWKLYYFLQFICNIHCMKSCVLFETCSTYAHSTKIRK